MRSLKIASRNCLFEKLVFEGRLEGLGIETRGTEITAMILLYFPRKDMGNRLYINSCTPHVGKGILYCSSSF